MALALQHVSTNVRWRFAAALQVAIFSQAFGQDGASCDGTWKYSHIDKSRGWPAEVEVRLSGERGTYFAHLGRHKAANSPCRDRNLPVEVERCTADELVFRVLGDEVVKGCPTFTARLKRSGPDSAEGTIGRNQVVSAHRER